MLRNCFLFIFLFLGIYNTLYSQQFTGKFLFGMVASQVDGDGLAGYNKPGVQLGLIVGKSIYNKLSIQAGFMYTSKGSWQKNSITPPGYSPKKINLQYAEVPFFVKYDLTQKWKLNTGIALGYLFYLRVTDEFGSFTHDQTEPYLSFDYTANLGVDYQLNSSFSAFLYMNRSLIFIRENPFHINNYISSGLYYHFR